jgi:hypothetical protein
VQYYLSGCGVASESENGTYNTHSSVRPQSVKEKYILTKNVNLFAERGCLIITNTVMYTQLLACLINECDESEGFSKI